MSDDLNWKEWFEEHKACDIVLYAGGEPWKEVDIEDFYQAFKARMIDELAVQAPDLRTLGVLVERPEDDGS